MVTKWQPNMAIFTSFFSLMTIKNLQNHFFYFEFLVSLSLISLVFKRSLSIYSNMHMHLITTKCLPYLPTNMVPTNIPYLAQIRHIPLNYGQSEPMPTSTPFTRCPLWFNCGWTLTELTSSFTLVTHPIRSWYYI